MLNKDKKSSPIIGTYTSNIGGHAIQYTVKRGARCRYARIEFRPTTGLSVVIPRHYAPDRVPALLQEKQEWITRQITKQRPDIHLNNPLRIAIGNPITFLGHTIRVTRNSAFGACKKGAYLMGDKLIVNCDDAALEKVVADWYRKQALLILKRKVDETSALLGVKYHRLMIRGQKTRWGSCSRKGTLSFNWKLMMFEESVIDYVVLHEIAHLQEMNHSKRFWTIVARYCLRYHEYRKWLRLHGQQIAGLAGE